MDALLIASNSNKQKMKLKKGLMNEFKKKDLGQVYVCLGMQICCDLSSGCIITDQEKYIYETMERFGMKDCNETSAP